MIARLFVAIALLGLSAAAAPAPDPRMTLAEARRLSPEALAVRLLGPAGASRHYVEADVAGNRGGLVFVRGLYSIDLYRAPEPAGFDGLCKVEGVTIRFKTARGEEGGDPPHAVRDFYKFTRFAVRTDRPCSELGPVAKSRDPRFFWVQNASTDPTSQANFAMQAVIRARQHAGQAPDAIQCRPDPGDTSDRTCDDPRAAARDFPIGKVSTVAIVRCEDQPRYHCVRATYPSHEGEYQGQDTELTIATNAERYDPLGDFAVRSVAVKVSTWAE